MRVCQCQCVPVACVGWGLPGPEWPVPASISIIMGYILGAKPRMKVQEAVQLFWVPSGRIHKAISARCCAAPVDPPPADPRWAVLSGTGAAVRISPGYRRVTTPGARVVESWHATLNGGPDRRRKRRKRRRPERRGIEPEEMSARDVVPVYIA